MPTLEELGLQCVTVCEVPINVSEDVLLAYIETRLCDGRILDSAKVEEIESGEDLTKFVFLLSSAKDFKYLCKDVMTENFRTGQGREVATIKYRESILSELPKKWKAKPEVALDLDSSQCSDEYHIPESAPPVPPRLLYSRLYGDSVPKGVCGPMSGFYHNFQQHDKERQTPGEKPSKIVVRNLPSTAHEDYLEMFFENTRLFGGGPVESVEYDEEDGSAVIEFKQPEAVDKVLRKRPIKMLGVEVEVDVPEEPTPLCTVEVTGPCSIVCEDQLETLEMHFENKKKSNGGEVEKIRFDSENNMVLVTFQDKRVARSVVKKASHMVMKESLTVKMHVPTKISKKKAAISESAKDEDQESEPVRTVKVKGVDKENQRDTIEYYFENAKRSGGGEIESVISDEEEDDILYITFRHGQDAKNVAKRTHKVKNRLLTVTLHVPPPSYSNRILIKGLKPSTSQDCLFNFIEAKTEFIPESMDFHAEQEDVVMVTFENDIDFDILKYSIEKTKLEGASLNVSHVPISNCIIVANLAQEVTIDTVSYYFENERKSGGGTVSKVVMNDYTDTCLVYFDDYTVIYRVLGRKHKLDGQELDVKLFQACLGRPEGDVSERKLRVPDPIIIKDVDPQKIKFMAHSKANRDALDTQLKDCHTSIVWPEGKAVNKVLRKRPIKMLGVEVEVDVPEEPTPLCTVEVTGPCSIVCEDQLETLEMYFENKKKSNGGEVEKIRFDSENNMVLVTFQDKGVARSVVKMASHMVMKECLTVKMHVPTKISKKKAAISESAKDEDQESEPVRTVKVKGVDKENQRDAIEYYFENAKHSGGGEIESVISDVEEDDILYITFRHGQDAKNVAKRTHKVKNRRLTVTLYVPPPSYSNRILIKGLEPSTSQDCLFNFIEAKTEFIPESMDFHAEQEDVVMVTFENDIDFDILKYSIEKTKLEGASLNVSHVPISNCIIVANLAHEVTIDSVSYYFENERKSGGGTVSKVVMNDYTDTCLVYFDDYTVIYRVLGRKHKLDGQELDVKLFQACLGRPEGDVSERKLRVPDPIIIKDVDPQKIKFMAHSKANRDALDTQLKDCHTSIVWPEGKGNILLECTLTTDVKDCFILVRTWKDNAVKTFNEFIENITVNRVSVLKDVWTKVLEEVKTLKIAKPDDVALMLEENKGFITIVGKAKTAKKLTKQISDIREKEKTDALKATRKDDSDDSGDTRFGSIPSDSRASKTIGLQGSGISAHCKILDCKNIYTCIADMTTLSADMLVTTVDKKLSMSRGLAHDIVKKGGSKILSECTAYIQTEGQLEDGKVFVSSAGSLNADFVAHAMGPVWNGGNDKEDELLGKTVFKCLEQATIRSLTSIAIPAISCGLYKYPVERATSVIVDAVTNFFLRYQKSTVTDVFLCDVNMITVNGFNDALQRKFGSSFQKFKTLQKPTATAGDGLDPPPTWDDMVGNLRIVRLKQSDQEYSDISQKFLATSGPGFTIVMIERVQNQTQWVQYQAKKKQLQDQNPPNTTNERFLWHGTVVEAVDNINANGFNRGYCGEKAVAYGDGVYFAANAKCSCRDTYSRPDSSGVKRVYYCRVLTGEYTQGQRGMRVPPSKSGGDSTALYDCVVDNPNSPGMYIIFQDTQAYPEYLVSVRRMSNLTILSWFLPK